MKNIAIIFITTMLIMCNISCLAQKQNPSEFVPEGLIISEKIYGDLNKDGINDCVLLIKGTNKNNIINDEYRGELDRNRRGIIILFSKNDNYILAVKNINCFSSENEDGGNYFPPELSISIKKGNLYIKYSHGRYGYWIYTFRYQNSNFELIGYDSSYGNGPAIDGELSINFLTKRKWTKVKINEYAESGEEVFEKIWERIDVKNLLKLSKIKDFDTLEIPQIK